jgi:4-carboxymuconolactone decarboxylase
MTQEIHLAAILAREGRLLMYRPAGASLWELPGGVLPPGEDIDEAMDALLARDGLHAPAIEEDFLQTAYLPGPAGSQVVLNLYAPTDWSGEPTPPNGAEIGWFGLEEFEALPMDGAVRSIMLSTFGFGDPDEDDLMLALASGLEELTLNPLDRDLIATPPLPTSRERGQGGEGLDVLRTISGGDPEVAAARMEKTSPEIARDVIDFALGQVWSHPALDRRTRSLQVVAMLAATGGKQGPLRSHLNGALTHGATPEQLVQTLRMVAVYAGFPAALDAWPLMEEVFAARGIPRPGRPT